MEQFSALSGISSLRHAFIGRVPGIDVANDKAEALRRLDAVHRRVRQSLGLGGLPLLTAEQVHGNHVAVVDRAVATDKRFDGCDGIVTDQPDILLGIYVADCGAIFLADPVRQVIGLVHSGKKGTELGIVAQAIDLMVGRFGSTPGDIIVQLAPCIRPPHYEIDFAAEILRQARERGVRDVHDSGVCTACEPARYYSYRAEKGKTGRMLALLAMLSNP